MHANEKASNHRLLVFDCHEAWVYQLRAIGRDLDVIVGLPGRAITAWDTSMRPLPPNARCVQLADVLAAQELYDCIIAHNLSDLLDVKSLQGPRLLVIHGTLGGMILDQHTATPPDELRRAVSQSQPRHSNGSGGSKGRRGIVQYRAVQDRHHAID